MPDKPDDERLKTPEGATFHKGPYRRGMPVYAPDAAIGRLPTPPDTAPWTCNWCGKDFPDRKGGNYPHTPKGMPNVRLCADCHGKHVTYKK